MKLYKIFEQLIIEEVAKARLLSEGVSPMDINDAIDKKINVNILYDDTPNAEIPSQPSERYIQPYAIGTSTAGNAVLRAFQINGGSKTTPKTGAWKYFRLDRIRGWKPTNMKFHTPIHWKSPDGSIPHFNRTDDRSMRRMDKNVQFKDSHEYGEKDDENMPRPKPVKSAPAKPKLSGPVPTQTPIAKPEEPKKAVLKPKVQPKPEPQPAPKPEPAQAEPANKDNANKVKKDGNSSTSRPKQAERNFG